MYSILPSAEDVLWIGTSGYGMYKLEINRNVIPYSVKGFTHYSFRESSNKSLISNIIYSIIQDDDKHLWIATRGGGLNRFDLDSKTFQVFKYDSNNEHTLSSNDILSLCKDTKGTLWVGTSVGLNKLLRLEKGKVLFTHFSEKDGMPNNTIHGILEDDENNIWVSTNNGLAKLIPENNKYRIISYYKKDGLQENEFSDGAAYSNLNMLYFGGNNGFCVFNPMKISQNDYIPPLWLDAFYLDNKEESLSDYITNGKVVLSYKNKSFSFRFAALDYLSASKCEIAYLLEGYQKDWIQLGTSNTIVLSNLPKGNYVLKVRCTNADKVWSQRSFALPLKMTPPFWCSAWAYLFYVVLFLALSLIIQKVIRNQLNAKDSIKQKEQEKQKAKEIHQAKLRFFTNIAHEFSNSLTLIYGPCEQLLRSQLSVQNTKKYVNVIKSNSERMQGLIQQLIDFRKAETGHLSIKIEEIDISELLKYVLT